MPYLQEIQDIQSYEDLDAFTTKSDFTFAGVLSLWMESNPSDATQHILGISRMSFFLDDAADYEDLENMSDYTRLIYESEKEKAEIVLTQCGYTKEEADQIYEGAIQFEKTAAQWCYNSEEVNLTDTREILNAQVYKPEDLEQYTWYGLLKDLAANEDIQEIPAVWLCEKKDYFEHLDELFSDENVELIKDYLLAHTANEAMRLLDKETYYKRMDILNEVRGSTGYRKDSDYAVSMVSEELAWPLSRIYCDQYVTAQDKQTIYELIEEIVDAYKEMLQEEDFLTEATKKKAIEKLDKLRIKCMYPDDWSEYDYGDLELSDSYFETVTKIEQYKMEKEFSKFDEPVNKDLWSSQPIVQNAFYDLQYNSINILPGLVGDIFYSSDMSKEEVYGKLVAYFDSISIWDGINCSGEMDKTEACAENRTPEQIYYVASYDVHPVSYLRVNATVAQFQEFYDAFDVKEGDGMYIAPEDRVNIW